jgi:hypothetical protein
LPTHAQGRYGNYPSFALFPRQSVALEKRHISSKYGARGIISFDHPLFVRIFTASLDRSTNFPALYEKMCCGQYFVSRLKIVIPADSTITIVTSL